MTGPYRDLPSHGIAYDTWAGVVQPEIDDDGFAYMPEHVSIGINAGPAVRRARHPRRGHPRARDRRGLPARGRAVRRRRRVRLAPHRDVARRTSGPSPRSPATRPTTTSGARPAPPACEDGVRYQFYETTDGHVLFMASEQAFWKNFCEGVGRARPVRAVARLEVRRPRPRQHASCSASCATSSHEDHRRSGSSSASEHNTPIAPVNTPKTIADDPQFQDRLPWMPAARARRRQLPTPDQVRRRGAARADEGADARRAHRTRCCARRSAGRRADRQGPGGRRARLGTAARSLREQ